MWTHVYCICGPTNFRNTEYFIYLILVVTVYNLFYLFIYLGEGGGGNSLVSV